MIQFYRIVLIALTCASANFITACGNSTTTTQPAAASGSCGAGYVFTSNLGCLQQTQACSGSKAIINGSCQEIASTTLQNVNPNPNPTGQAQSCQAGSVWSFNYNQCLTQSATCSGQYGVLNGSCVVLGTAANPTAPGGANPSASRNPFQGNCPTPGMVPVQGQCLSQGPCQNGYAYGFYQNQPFCYRGDFTY